MRESNQYNGQNRAVPQEIKGWNWGAFSFSVWWGIGNKTYLPLLCLVPLVSIIWVFVCGFKGNEWAWKKGNYRDVESFKMVQGTWNLAGLIYFIGSIIIWIIFILFFYAPFIALLGLHSS